jgi:hypothetical protein
VSPSIGRIRAATGLAVLTMFALLLWRVWVFGDLSVHALYWPYELDYAEGIVWQQAALIFTSAAYGPIDGFPTIVFHYTPLYHAIASGISALTGADMLYTGRLISIVSTVLMAVVAGAIAKRTSPADASPRIGLIIAGAAGLALFSMYAIVLSGLVMRSDMLAVLLSAMGFWLGLKAFERPALIYAAALCFVAAIYTKQTALPAPAALFAMMLLLRPRLALRGIAACIVLGLIVLAILSVATDGGFVRHIFLYNINRIIWPRLGLIGLVVSMQAPLFWTALFAAVFHGRDLQSRWAGKPWQMIAEDRADVARLGMIFYLITTTLMLITVAKVGSYLNYFVEWLLVVAVVAATALYPAARALFPSGNGAQNTARAAFAAVIVPLAFAVQPLMIERPVFAHYWSPARAVAVEKLAALVRAADRPVISDEMVMVLRSGKTVVWEPMIFVELASTGLWDERPFVAQIRNGAFAMFITTNDHDWSPAVRQAIEDRYPVKRNFANYTAHLPMPVKAKPKAGQ